MSFVDNFRLGAIYEQEEPDNAEDQDQDEGAEVTGESEKKPEPKPKKEKPEKVDTLEKAKAKKAKEEPEEEDEEEEDGEDPETDDSDEEDEDDGELSEIGQLMTKLVEKGVLLTQEEKDGYTDSEDGLSELIEDTVATKLAEEKDKIVSNLDEEERRVLDFIQKGGKIKDYIAVTEVDYSQADLDDEGHQRSLVATLLRKEGYSEDEVSDEIDTYEETGILRKRAEKAQKRLEELQKKEKEKMLKDQEEEIKAREARRKEQVQRFRETVMSTEQVKGFKIAKEEKEKLYDYITKPVDKKTGMTQFQIDQRNPENLIANAYMSMKGFDFEKVKKDAETKATVKIKKQLSNSSSGAKAGSAHDGGMKPKKEALPSFGFLNRS